MASLQRLDADLDAIFAELAAIQNKLGLLRRSETDATAITKLNTAITSVSSHIVDLQDLRKHVKSNP